MRAMTDDLETTSTPPPLPANDATRKRHEALAAVEREITAMYGTRVRNLPRLIAELRALL
jgi:hypothetical protein